MKEVDILRDIINNRIANQLYYNEKLVEVRNPEIINLFTMLRDDEMRAIGELQQKIQRLETNIGVISRIFS